MKPNLFNRIALSLVLIIVLAVVIVSCKKDKLTEPLNNNNQEILNYDSDTKQIVQRIKKFDELLKDVKNGMSRSDFLVDADSAIWDIESLFNATYSFPDENYVAKKVQELSFDVKIIDNKISIEDVGNLYDEIVASVRDAYRDDGFTDNKSLMSVFVTKEETRSGVLGVKLVVVSGRTDQQQYDYKPVLYGPFSAYACWYYGEYGGSCDDPSMLTDAAELLEDTINYYHAYKPEKYSDRRNIYVNLLSVCLKGNEYWNNATNDYYIFYKVDCDMEDLYLDGNLMNRYYYNEVDVVKEIVPKDPMYSSLLGEDYVFMEINIDGIKDYRMSEVYRHQNYIFYGTPYSVKNEELGAPVDLLYN